MPEDPEANSLDDRDRIRELEERLQGFVEVASDWFWEMDANYRYTYVSVGIIEGRHENPKNMIGKTHDEVLGELACDPTQQQFLRRLKARDTIKEMYLCRNQSPGKRLWASVNAQPKFDANNNFVGYRGTAIDITEQVEAELALKAREAMWSGLLSISADAIVICNADQVITTFNQGACAMFGYEAEEVLGAPLEILMPERFRGDHKNHVHQFDKSAMASRLMAQRGIVYGIRKNAEEFPADASISKLSIEGETVYSVIIRDVTSRLSNQEQLLSAKGQAEYANRAKTEFLANMSHELRTPLNAILGFSQVLQLDMEDSFSPRQQSYIGSVLDSGEQLLNKINEILELSNLDAGNLVPEKTLISAKQICRSIIDIVLVRAKSRDIDIRYNVTQADVRFIADESMFRKMMLNLLTNAVKFTEDGGGVYVDWKVTATSFEIRVKDTGIGLSPEDIPKALSSFGQIDGKLNRQYEGSGLGLPLTKKLLELHGGHLEIFGQTGVGTTTILHFPLETLEVNPH
mgnify:FL=1